ncbi:MAG TPA: 4-hydroxythreonine-4-phosphate dehydrogenase PdxA [Gemmatimonadaceae bacterium]|nr:4-hydroxythreonine-4-phosphate dehydrogenase PdxA [Gemmatimonadaceae bacterium]
MNVDRKARLAVTLGDARGIGPEIIEKAAASREVREATDLVFVGPSGAGIDVTEQTGSWTPGGSASDAGRFAGRAIERSVALALQGEVDGIVTAPIDKAALLAGGYSFPGHTEMIATYTGRKVAMMLAATRPSPGSKSPLRVVLATTHLPLRDVPAAVTSDALVSAATITRNGLREWFAIAEPKIALCALNPHAGDEGRFGNEDDEVLRPAAAEAGIAGPFPADTVFVRAMRGEFDAVIAPYHDVGMTAIKVASFGAAVNVTLGLPFPRTSPDHGTALDIAGKGVADPSSMIEAILMCARIATRVGAPRPATAQS